MKLKKLCKSVKNIFSYTQQNQFFTSTKNFAYENVLNKTRFVFFNQFLSLGEGSLFFLLH